MRGRIENEAFRGEWRLFRLMLWCRWVVCVCVCVCVCVYVYVLMRGRIAAANHYFLVSLLSLLQRFRVLLINLYFGHGVTEH